MGVLILLSALFSGSEAALFSLPARSRRRLNRSGVGGPIAARLLQQPERLLSAILFWNLLINMTYFAIAAIIGGRLEADPQAGRPAAVVFTVITLLTIIFFSEMLPKSLAVMSPLRLSILVGPPLAFAVQIVSPILPAVKISNLFARRLIWPGFTPEPEIELSDIERAIELGTDDAVLIQRERLAMRGVVEMAESRVSEVMRPRARLTICPAPVTLAVLQQGTPAGGFLLVTDPKLKKIIAAIGVRRLRPSQLDDLKAAAEAVIFVPWSARVSQVWDQLNEEDCGVAVVVNEFGEAIGALSTDDILRVVLAPRRGRDEVDEASIQELAADCYRVNGSASLRALAKRLSLEIPEEGIATVAGYMQRHNERRPREGDRAVLGRFELIVSEAQENEVWIDVQPIPDEFSDLEGNGS
jgi:CBS domain containing-hemolysin-like protein